MEKFELRLEELKVFCEDLLDSYEIDGLLEFNQANLEKLMMHWEDYFPDDEDVLIFNEEQYQNILKEFESDLLSDTLRGMVSDGLIDVEWNPEINDFVFKKKEDNEDSE